MKEGADESNYALRILSLDENQQDVSQIKKNIESLLAQGGDLLFIKEQGEAETAEMLARANKNIPFIKAMALIRRETGELKWHAQNKQRFEITKKIKEVGHILGLSKVTIEGVKTEGWFPFESYALLQNVIKKHANKHPDSEGFSEDAPLQTAIELAVNYLKMDGQITHDDFINRHHQGLPTIIPTGWAGHGVTLVAWNDVLIVCNRGDKKFDSPVAAYKISPPKEITKAFLQEIIPEGEIPDSQQVIRAIRKLVDVEKPIAQFPGKEQKHGTCSFVNGKISICPILCFMKLLKLCGKAFTEFNSDFLASEKNKYYDALEEAEAEYKGFTNDMRDEEIEELSKEYSHLAPKSIERKVYFQLLVAILKQHHGQDRYLVTGRGAFAMRGRERKKSAEIKRAQKILSVLSEDNKKEIASATPSLAVLIQAEAVQSKAPFHSIKEIKEFFQTVPKKDKVNFIHQQLQHIIQEKNPAEKIESIVNLLATWEDKKACLTQSDAQGKTILIHAAQSGDIKAIKVILEAYPRTIDTNRDYINQTDLSGNSALSYGIKQNSFVVIKAMLDEIYPIEKRNEVIMDELDPESTQRITALLAVFPEKFRIDFLQENTGRGAPLDHAVRSGSIQKIKAILYAVPEEERVKLIRPAILSQPRKISEIIIMLEAVPGHDRAKLIRENIDFLSFPAQEMKAILLKLPPESRAQVITEIGEDGKNMLTYAVSMVSSAEHIRAILEVIPEGFREMAVNQLDGNGKNALMLIKALMNLSDARIAKMSDSDLRSYRIAGETEKVILAILAQEKLNRLAPGSRR